MPLQIKKGAQVASDGTFSSPLEVGTSSVAITLAPAAHESTSSCVVKVVAVGDTFAGAALSGWEVSADGTTWATSVDLGALTAPVTVYVRRTSGSLRGRLAASLGTYGTTNQIPAAFTPTATAGGTDRVTVTATTTDADSDTLTYRIAVITSATPPTDWSTYPDRTAAQMAAGVEITGLSAGTTYRAHVRAVDGFGGERLGLATVTTTAPPDSQAPTLGGALVATPGDAQVVLTWPAATDNVAVHHYEIQRDTVNTFTAPVDLTETSALTLTDTGRTNGTTYYYRYRAVDASENHSAWSATASATPALAIVTSGLLVDLRGRTSNSTKTAMHANTDSDKATWYDLSGNGRNATLTTGSNAWAYTTSDGWAGAGTAADPYRLVGDGGGYVAVPDLGTLTSFTIDGWVKLNIGTTDFVGWFDNFVSAPGGGTDFASDGFMLDFSSSTNRGKPRFVLGKRQTPTVSPDHNGHTLLWSTAINDGAYHWICFWYDAATTTMGLTVDNGTPLTAVVSYVSLASPATRPRALFGDGGSTNYMNGSIPQFRVYNRVLSSTERTTNYSLGPAA